MGNTSVGQYSNSGLDFADFNFTGMRLNSRPGVDFGGV